MLRTGVIWKSWVGGGWISSRSGWLLELLTELITKNRNPLNSAHGYGRRANDPRLNMVIRTLRRQHRFFTTELVLWPNNPIIGGWAVLFTPWKYIFSNAERSKSKFYHFLEKLFPSKGCTLRVCLKILCSPIQSPHLCWRSLTDLYIFIWGSTYGMDRNVETKYTFCQRPFSWNLSCILQQERVTTLDKKLQILRAENFNIQFK